MANVVLKAEEGRFQSQGKKADFSLFKAGETRLLEMTHEDNYRLF